MQQHRCQRVRSRTVLGAAAGLAVVAATVVAGVPAPAQAAAPSRVLLVGDSLAWEASPLLSFLVGPRGWQVLDRTYGGTAPCDWVEQLRADRALAPKVVLVSFSGNTLTACTRVLSMTPSAAQTLAVYRSSLATISGLFRNAKVVLVGQPAIPGHPVVDQLNDLLRRLDARYAHVSFVDAGASVERPDGGFVERLGCLGFEGPDHGCVDGTIRVRAADRVHFCPPNASSVAGVVGRCPVWSAGAWRFAAAMATVVR